MSGNPKMTGARYIAETLKKYGITHVFYVDAILRMTLAELEELGVMRVGAHSEKGAAYMADGYARVSGRPGVCMAQSVGAANLAAGLQDAYLGLSPVIALTGKKPPMAQHRNAYQEIDHQPLFEPVTKYNVDVVTIEQLPHVLRQAFREATTGAPQPVHLDVAGHTGRILEAAEIDAVPSVDEPFRSYPAFRLTPNIDALQRATEAIEAASHPVIVAGGGARLSGAGPAIVALAEKRSIPVVTSVNGKGTIPENHPLSVGIVGTYSMWSSNRIVHEADLVIFIGSHTGDQVTNNWMIPQLGTTIVQIDIDPAELGRSYPNTIGVVGDAKVTSRMLTERLTASPADETWRARVQEHVDGWHAEYEPFLSSEETPIRPERLCKDLTEILPEDGILVADTGFSAIWTATMMRIQHHSQTYIRAAGSLGWAFPASLGTKCAAPDRTVICFTGDGGFWYHFPELETARRYGIHTVTVINNNGGFSQSIDDITRIYANRPGDPEQLYTFGEVNFARIAGELGCFGIRVEHPGDIVPAMQQAVAADRPAVVEVLTDFSARAPAPWSPM
jgi:acetolactate synthase-1/2/3 large subunit